MKEGSFTSKNFYVKKGMVAALRVVEGADPYRVYIRPFPKTHHNKKRRCSRISVFCMPQGTDIPQSRVYKCWNPVLSRAVT